MVYLACVVMVAPIIRSTYGNTSIYAYTSIYVVCGPEIYAFRTTLLMQHVWRVCHSQLVMCHAACAVVDAVVLICAPIIRSRGRR